MFPLLCKEEDIAILAQVFQTGGTPSQLGVQSGCLLVRPPCGALQSPWGRVMGQVGLRGAIGSGCSALSQQCSEPGAGKSSFA